MALPAGIETRTVRIRVPLDTLGDEAYIYDATIRVNTPLVWAATGDLIWPVAAGLPDPVNGVIEIDVPIVDQPGVVDAHGAPIANWSYRIIAKGTWRGGERRTGSKVFQVSSDDPAVVDVDLLAPATTVPPTAEDNPYVRNIAGHTGTVTGEQIFAAVGGMVAGAVDAGTAAQVTSRTVSTPRAYFAAAEVGAGTGKTLSVVGVDPIAGTLLASDRTGGNLSISGNNGATWTHGRGNVPNTLQTPAPRLLRFGAHIYAMAVSSVDGRLGIYRSNPATPSQLFSWSARLAMASESTSSINGKGTIFNAGTSALMLGDYGDYNAPGAKIQRSLDGVNWTTVWGPSMGLRHVHCVDEDPFNPGHWYASLGDNLATECLIRSLDNGDTWESVIDGSGSNAWQGVQISFDAEAIYMASDRYGHTAVYIDRATLTPRIFGADYHAHHPVPGGRSARIVTDLVTTASSAIVTSATAAFTTGLSKVAPSDIGRRIKSPNIPDTSVGTGGAGPIRIDSVQSATQATLSAHATATGTGQTALIGGDEFFWLSYMGAVDPATGIYYVLAQDTSVAGNHFGLFAALGPEDEWRLLDYGPNGYSGGEQLIVHNGWVFTGGRKVPLLQRG